MGVEHPPNGQMKAFAVGCGMCRDLKIKGNGELADKIAEQTKKIEEMKKSYLDF